MAKSKKTLGLTRKQIDQIFETIKKRPKYAVLWRDAQHDCDNKDISTPMKPAYLVTLGFLIREDEGSIEFCGELDPGDKNWARHVSEMPEEMIVEMREI